MIIIRNAKRTWADFACENPGAVVVMTLIVCSAIKATVWAFAPTKV